MGFFGVKFQNYSIELAVDEWASDDIVSKRSVEENKVAYKKAMEEVRLAMRRASKLFTLGLHLRCIPVRVVRKGEERFVNSVN